MAAGAQGRSCRGGRPGGKLDQVSEGQWAFQGILGTGMRQRPAQDTHHCARAALELVWGPVRVWGRPGSGAGPEGSGVESG